MAEQAFDTFTGYQQSKQQEKQAEYQAQVADNNRRASLSQGVADENRMRSRSRTIIGEQYAGTAENGLFGGSAFDLLKESMVNIEYDAQTARASYLQNAQNIKQQADIARYQAKQYGQQARQQLVKGGFKMANTVAKAMVGMPTESTAFQQNASGGNIAYAPSGAGNGKASWIDPDTGKRY
ncbi:MAG: hypothetical protein EBU90_24410 [Proteobacteria bacterium]|nr:hypothetical protein [Pseudomonadota bacterium]